MMKRQSEATAPSTVVMSMLHNRQRAGMAAIVTAVVVIVSVLGYYNMLMGDEVSTGATSTELKIRNSTIQSLDDSPLDQNTNPVSTEEEVMHETKKVMTSHHGLTIDMDQLRQQYMSIDEAKRKHPVCFSDDMFHYDDKGRPYLIMGEVVEYVASDLEPRYTYDHSCFIMKSRYNCAFPNNTAPPGELVATDYKMILKTKNGDICDIRHLINDIGGPFGVLEALKRENPDKRVWTFPFMGDSALRQIWEGFICNWPDQMTSIKVRYDGPVSHVETIERKRRHGNYVPYKPEEAGRVVEGFEVMDTGCHGYSKIKPFYFDGVVVPRNNGKCADDLAEVTFLDSLRIPYIFHAEYHESVEHLLGMLNVTVDMADAFFGVKGTSLLVSLPSIVDGINTSVLDKSMDFSHSWVANRQMHDIGYVFGAKNGMNQEPDAHGCMPGPLDDIDAVVLFSWLRGGVGFTGGQNPPFLEYEQLLKSRRKRN